MYRTHQVGDLVYSLFYGFGYISKIDERTGKYLCLWFNYGGSEHTSVIGNTTKEIDYFKSILRNKIEREESSSGTAPNR